MTGAGRVPRGELTVTCRWCGHLGPDLESVLVHQLEQPECAKKTRLEEYRMDHQRAKLSMGSHTC